MKILVMNIPLRPELPLKLFPVGLGFITTAMKVNGWKFDLLDIDVLRWSDDCVDAHLMDNAYDVVCFGIMVTGYKHVKRLSKIIKATNPDCRIIAGNSVATSIPRILLENTEADIAVMGEGDETIIELLDAISQRQSLRHIKGIWFKDHTGKIVVTEGRPLIEDISALPNVDFSIFDVQEYIRSSPYAINGVDPDEQIRALPISTARGCVAKCTFCYHVFLAKKYRYRTAESIVNELIDIKDKYGINYVQFWDELTFFSKRQTDELSQAIIDSGVNVSWMARCRPNLFSEDEDVNIIKKMKEAGCKKVQYSLESGDPEILKSMKKKTKVSHFIRQTELFREAGLEPITSLVLGMPLETPETIRRTIDCCIESGIFPSAGYLLPQPGSPMYQYALDNGYIKDEEEYILKMGDRQDLLVNMTRMTDDEFKSTVVREMKRCNDALSAGYGEHNLIKTSTPKE